MKDYLSGNITSPPTAGDELKLYVVLCYRDCPTDNVPIPGEPCRNENELTAASRIKDDFSLELRFEPPKQAEEDAIEKFAQRLKEIEIIETGTGTTLTDFLQALRDEFIPPVTSPPIISPPIISPPVVLQILKDDVGEYMKAAFRLWVTELRTVLSERKTGCSVEMTGGGKLEDCILLGELKIPLVALSPGFKVSDSEDPLVNEEKRPFLLHLRMLQEWLTGGVYGSGEAMFMGLSEISADTPSLDKLSDVALPSPVADGQVLMFDNGHWTAKPIVVKLHEKDISKQNPKEGDSLIFTGGVWTPKKSDQAQTKPVLNLPLATVTRIDKNIYEIWFNIDAPGNLAEIVDLKPDLIQVFDETDSPPPFLTAIKHTTSRIIRNVFSVRIGLGANQLEPNYLRFNFSVNKIKVVLKSTELSLLEYAEKSNIRFPGYLEGEFATVFVRGTGGKE